MNAVQVFSFHTMRPVAGNTRIAYRLATFKPGQPARVIGATLGLLTNSIADHSQGCVELYLSVTYDSEEPSAHRNWESMKRGFVFYLQRDVYAEPIGADDLTRVTWLPEGDFFPVSLERPLHVHVGVGNMLPYETDYDAFGCLYYI